MKIFFVGLYKDRACYFFMFLVSCFNTSLYNISAISFQFILYFIMHTLSSTLFQKTAQRGVLFVILLFPLVNFYCSMDIHHNQCRVDRLKLSYNYFIRQAQRTEINFSKIIICAFLNPNLRKQSVINECNIE